MVNQVPFDLAGQGYALCISDTKGSHADLTDDYATIRREMESVAEFFGKMCCVRWTKQISMQTLPRSAP